VSDQPQGSGTPEVSQGTDVPEYVSKTEFNEQLNRAITARTKQLEAKHTQSTEALMAKFDEMLSTRLEAFKPAAPASTPAADAPPSPTDSPEFKAMAARLAKMDEQWKTESEKRKSLEAKERDTTMRSRITEYAAEHKVDAKRAKVLVGHLVDSEKRVSWSEDGESLVYRTDDGDTVDYKSGLLSFFKSEDGKLFIPPTGASGSGDRGGGKSGASGAAGLQPGQLGRAILGIATGNGNG
jgi:hypothetical protein